MGNPELSAAHTSARLIEVQVAGVGPEVGIGEAANGHNRSHHLGVGAVGRLEAGIKKLTSLKIVQGTSPTGPRQGWGSTRSSSKEGMA